MKRIFTFALALTLLLLGLGACTATPEAEPEAEAQQPEPSETQKPAAPQQEEKPPQVTPQPHPLMDLDEDTSYKAVAEELFTYRSSDPLHNITQGAYFDGDYFYIAAVHRQSDGFEHTRILKLDDDGDLIEESEPLPLDHANNITYNENLGLLVVSHCQSPDGHYYRYSMVDPDTFEVVQSDDLPHPFFSMAYSHELDMYASGEWSGETLDIWDGEMNLVLQKNVEWPPTLSQGVFCDARGIYFIRSSQFGYGAEIRIYDWELELIRTVPVHLPDTIEPENINIVDGEIFVTANTPNGGTVYLLYIEPSE